MQSSRLIFYGVRGSYPVPDKKVLKFGGNTSCVLIESGDRLIVLDAGTGIINLGSYLKQEKNHIKHIHIFLTHLHIDHIQGIPFFEPVYDPEFKIDFYCNDSGDSRLEEAIFALFNQPLSPIGKNGIKAGFTFNTLDIENRNTIDLGNGICVDYIKESHPVAGVLIYNIDIDGARVVYATDVETPSGFSPSTMDFIQGADILIHDSMYFDWDYYSPKFSKEGFGHSTVTMAVENAIKTNIKKLFLFHYNPNYSDDQVREMLQEAKQRFPDTYLSEELKEFKIRR